MPKSAATIYANGQTYVYMWEATYANCGEPMLDNRDGTTRVYNTALINGQCWMTTNLSLGKSTTTTLTSATTNLNGGLTSYTLAASSSSTMNNDNGSIYISNSTNCSSSSGCYGYYSYRAATAGIGSEAFGGEATSDICAKGWRLPTYSELVSLKNTYTTGDTLNADPFNGVYNGWFGYNDTLKINRNGTRALYWSSLAQDNGYNAYNLSYGSSDAYVSASIKSVGLGIRCVMK
jgi:uncharacterized protein (TIGR02145 family)